MKYWQPYVTYRNSRLRDLDMMVLKVNHDHLKARLKVLWILRSAPNFAIAADSIIIKRKDFVSWMPRM